jgi:hypothetical protein
MNDTSEYCREIETYLCRKNEGHLIRIVGPAFEQVCGWASRGVPLKVAFKGIDRYCERYYAKGPRRRPVRIEFCEADILEMFDDWRRAVGVAASGDGSDEPQRRTSLASHVDRVVARLTSLRGGAGGGALGEHIDRAVRELDALRADAQHARGDRRADIVARLERIDRDLMSAAVAQLDEQTSGALRRDAEAELSPFASRMPADALTAAADAAFARLVRDAIGLPTIDYE